MVRSNGLVRCVSEFERVKDAYPKPSLNLNTVVVYKRRRYLVLNVAKWEITSTLDAPMGSGMHPLEGRDERQALFRRRLSLCEEMLRSFFGLICIRRRVHTSKQVRARLGACL